jgi:hypothetical protein
MQKLTLILTLGVLLTPIFAFAKRHPDENDKPGKIRAIEMVPSGFAAAGLVGAAGYLVLRRRKLRKQQS